jgi:small subunit ribosomal protein S17e
LNKVRKLAEDLLAKYPSLFSTNFETNKKALDKVAIIRNRALRNQLAGAISSLVSEQAPQATTDMSTSLEELIPTEESPSDQSVAPTEVSQQAQ